MDNNLKKNSWINLFKIVWNFLDKDKFKFLLWIVIIGTLYSTLIIIPYIIGLIVNFFISYNKGDSLNIFYFYSLTVTAIIIFGALIRLKAKKELGGMAIRLKYLAKVSGFEKLLNFSLKWHQKESSGNRVQKIEKGTEALRLLVRAFYAEILSIFINFIGIIIIFIFLDIIFFSFFVLYLLVFFIIELYFNKKISILANKKNISLECAAGVYFESASNITSIKAHNTKKSFNKNIRNKEEITKEFSLKLRDIGIKKWKYFQTWSGLALGFFLILIGNGVVNQTVQVGFIFTYYVYFERLKHGAQDITLMVNKLIENKSSVFRMIPIFEEKEEKYFGKEKFPQSWSEIIFKNVFFNYELNKIGLKNITLKMKKNEKIGILGSSGSGKSTFGKILLGLYKIDSGKIIIGKNDFYDFSYDELMKNISVCMQETELFNFSLKENITLSKEVDRDYFRKILKICQIESIIKKLPNGINTILGEKGYSLSGGEKQRIGIARSLVKNTNCIIFDEATSSLDPKTEKLIFDEIYKLKNKTLIIISHNLSTLKNADKLVLFEGGEIIEIGQYDNLIKDKSSKFYKLLNLKN
jgi:ABC-type multidrug transport system fused ATPase/permease subunit